MLIEGLIFGVGAYFILNLQKQKQKRKIGLWSLLIFLVIIYLMNIFGSPPPSEKSDAFVGMFQWLIIAWGYWIDKNRSNVN